MAKKEFKFKVGDKIINPINEIWVVDGLNDEYCQVTRVKDGFQCYFKLQDQDQWKLAATDTELLDLLLGAIDYSFRRMDDTYDPELTYPVIDKIKYIERVRSQRV